MVPSTTGTPTLIAVGHGLAGRLHIYDVEDQEGNGLDKGSNGDDFEADELHERFVLREHREHLI